jgi:beta-alanine--pyruvate transaminase
MSQLTLDHWWQPFTNVRAFRGNPRLIVRGEGCFLYTPDGREILDITAGLWCANLGHGRREVADAVRHQLLELDFAPPFQFGAPVTFEFAAKLAEYAPPGLDRIFFTNSGSESVETAMKIAYAWQRARGKATKTRFVSRERGYHGVNVGGTSLQGIPNNRKGFPVLDNVDFLPDLLDISANAFSRGLPERGADQLNPLEKIIALRGAENLCAVIVEPIVGAGGMVPPPVGYLQRLRELCTQHDILLIFDEVVTGFGRTGAWFRFATEGARPDLLCVGKALTGGFPLSACVGTRAVMDAWGGSQGEALHTQTFLGNPLGCAMALAALDEVARLLPMVPSRSDLLQGLLAEAGFSSRGAGLLLGVPVANPLAAMRGLLERGFIALPAGEQAEVMALTPPLCTTPDQLRAFVAAFAAVAEPGDG